MISANQMLRAVGQEPRRVTLWCTLDPLEVQHYCMFCRAGLFRSRLRVFAILSGDAILEPFLMPPFTIQCHKCGAFYSVAGVAG